MTQTEGTDWKFDWEPTASDRFFKFVSITIFAIVVFSLTLSAYFALGLFACIVVFIAGALLVVPAQRWIERDHCKQPVRVTHLGLCMLKEGQTALRIVSLVMHPLCAVLTLRAHDADISQKMYRLIFWRHHFSVHQYRRMTIVFHWLSREVGYE